MVDYREDHRLKTDDIYNRDTGSGASLGWLFGGLLALAVIVGAIFMFAGSGTGTSTDAPTTLQDGGATAPAPAEPTPVQ